MAMSFSRPDPASPSAVADASFSTTRRGFDQNEVRDFLRMVGAELGRLHERERFLERELREAQANPDLDAARLDEEALTRLLGEETARVLHAARESANEIREKAEQAAARILAEANDESIRLREEAEVEASRRRADAAADAEAELSMAKQQGREMVNEARAYRERVLGELARRRELARAQIEQLIDGRDRLIQVFDRARVVAGDVVAELEPLGEPDEYVDLSPTTGPVPVMVARDAGPPTEPVDVVDAAAPAPVEEVPEEAVEEVAEDAPEAVEEVAEEVPEDVPDVVDPVDASAAAEDGPSSGDVVVDLFARLKAATPDADEPDAGDLDAAVDDTVDDTDAGEETATELAESGPFEQRDADLTPLIVSSARKLKRVLADEQNEVLDTLRRGDPVVDLDAVLPGAGAHAARYASAIADDLLIAAQSGASLATPDRVAALNRSEGKRAVAEGDEVLERWLVTPLRERLARCIADGDGDNAVITKKVRAVYREWKTQHIDEQLDDVLRTAHGRGLLAGLEPGTPVIWTVDPGHPGCPDCDDNALAGAIPAGDEFPTGHRFAPAHPGCRCLLTPTER